LGFYHSDLEALKLDFDEHLRTNPNSEIIGELNRANAVLQDFITDIEAQNLKITEILAKLAREKYKLNKVLEVGDKVQELKKTHKWFLELASHSPEMHEQLRHDILDVKHEIQMAEESQVKLKKWYNFVITIFIHMDNSCIVWIFSCQS
jgi:hypothetical protein